MQRRNEAGSGNGPSPTAPGSADSFGPNQPEIHGQYHPLAYHNLMGGANDNMVDFCNEKHEHALNYLTVDDAGEKLLQLALTGPGLPPQQSEMYVPQQSLGQQKSLSLDIKKSRLPSQTGDNGGLQILSPKTPNLLPELLHYGHNSSSEGLQPNMEIIDSFGGLSSNVPYLDQGDTFPSTFGSVVDTQVLPHEVHGVGLTPIDNGPMAGSLFIPLLQNQGLGTIIEHQRTESLSPGSHVDGRVVVSPGYNSGPSLIPQQTLSPSAMSSAFPQGAMSLNPSNQTSSANKHNNDVKAQAQGPPKPRGSRKKTLSLNPEEREALEDLIEDVIIGGIANDESSNSSDSDEDLDKSDVRQAEDGSNAGKDGTLNKEGLPKIYPAQLKVAVKHMRNLPPRFMRRLENAQKKIDAAERIEAERVQEEKVRYEIEAKEKEHEKIKFKEDQKREKKKKIRNLLDDLDQYTDELSVCKDDTRPELKTKESKRVERKAKPKPEVDGLRESSQPVHVGLSKGQMGQYQQHKLEQTVDFTQKLQDQHLGISSQGPPPVKAVNCEDLERELLGGTDYSMPVSAPMYLNNQQLAMMSMNNAIPHDLNALYAFSGMQQTVDMMDMSDRKTFLSAEAPEFVPYNMPVFQHAPPPISQNYPPVGFPMHGLSPQMQTSSSQMHGTQQSHIASPHVHGAKYKPVPNDSPPSASVEMLRTKSSSPYNQSPIGRLSPQVVASNIGLLSTPVMPVSSVSGTVMPNAPMPPTNPSMDQMGSMSGKLPTFMVPKVPTNVPPPPVSTGVPHNPGVGVLPMNPYQIPYTFPPAGFPPPQQGFPYQSFVPPPGYMPWTDNKTDKHAHRGTIGHHPLMGIPLKASPQMNRKRGGANSHGPQQSGALHHGFVQHKPPPTDVKVLGTDMAKKLVLQLLGEGKKVMVLLRGCPGSGKSTLAKEVCFDGTVLSTDDFFVNAQGLYEYDHVKLSDAHMWNQNRAKQTLEAGTNPIIVDNTNSQSWEMKTYISLALKNNYHIEIIEPDTPWKYNAKELEKRNSHRVTIEAIHRMLDRFEHNLTLQGIMGVKIRDNIKEATKENQQQNQPEGEQIGKKTQRRRKKKKRKRNRHRSKKDKEGSQGEEVKHSSDDSTDDDEKHSTPLKLLEKRASLSSNDTTTSPQETTPEMLEISDNPWENTFSDIKEDPQPEEAGFGDIEDAVRCKQGVEKVSVENNYPVKDDSDSEQNRNVKEIDSSTSGTVRKGTDFTKKDIGDSWEKINNDSAVINEDIHSAALNLVNKVIAKAGDALQSLDCAQNDPNNSIDICAHSAIIDRNAVNSDAGAALNNATGVSVINSTCDVSAPDQSDYVGKSSSTEQENLVSDGKTISNDTGDLIIRSSGNECDNSNVMCSNGDNPVETATLSSEHTEFPDDDDLIMLGMNIKEEVTNLLEEHILQALVKKELARVMDITQSNMTINPVDSLLPDVVSDSDDTEEMHIATLADLQKALEDIEYDNPEVEMDSDIDLDHEYGFEATGKQLKLVENSLDLDCEDFIDSVDLNLSTDLVDEDFYDVEDLFSKNVKNKCFSSDETCDCSENENGEEEDNKSKTYKSLDTNNDNWKEMVADSSKDDKKEMAADSSKDDKKEMTVDSSKEIVTDFSKDDDEKMAADSSMNDNKEMAEDSRKEIVTDSSKDDKKEMAADPNKEIVTDSSKDDNKEIVADSSKDDKKEMAADPNKEIVTDSSKDDNKEIVADSSKDDKKETAANSRKDDRKEMAADSNKDDGKKIVVIANDDAQNAITSVSDTAICQGSDDSNSTSSQVPVNDLTTDHCNSGMNQDNTQYWTIKDQNPNTITSSEDAEEQICSGVQANQRPPDMDQRSGPDLIRCIQSPGPKPKREQRQRWNETENSESSEVWYNSVSSGHDHHSTVACGPSSLLECQADPQELLSGTESANTPSAVGTSSTNQQAASESTTSVNNLSLCEEAAIQSKMDELHASGADDTTNNTTQTNEQLSTVCSEAQSMIHDGDSNNEPVADNDPSLGKEINIECSQRDAQNLSSEVEKLTASVNREVFETNDEMSKSLAHSKDSPSLDAFVQPDVRQKLFGQNWSIPAHNIPQTPVKVKAAPVKSKETRSMSSQVEHRDWVFVHKLDQSDLEAVLVIGDYNIQGILSTAARTILEAVGAVDEEHVKGGRRSSQAPTYHKSCQTDDNEQVQADQELLTKITTLQSCFSDTTREDIAHILEQCKGDVEWASNILLDGGPVPSTETEDTHKPAQSVPDDDDLQEVIDQLSQQTLEQLPSDTGTSLSTLDKQARTETEVLGSGSDVDNLDLNAVGFQQSAAPDSLVVMCHKRLSQQAVVTPDVLEQVSESNTDCMRSIDEYQHQHFQQLDDVIKPIDDSSHYAQIERYQNCVNPAKPMNAARGSMALDEFYLPPPMSRRVAEVKPVKPSPTHTPQTSISHPATVSDTVVLKLTPQLAQQLIQMFGPIEAPFAPVTLSEEELEVHLDRENARQIHLVWGQTLTRKLGTIEVNDVQQKSLEEDEALARRLQKEEYDEANKSSVGTSTSQANVFQIANKKNNRRNSKSGKKSTSSTPVRNSPARESPSSEVSISQSPVYQQSRTRNGEMAVGRTSPLRRSTSPTKTTRVQQAADVFMSPSRTAQPAPSFREIMDEEQALEASRLEYLDSQDDVKANEGTLSTRLKWQQLVEKFPGVDPQMLTDVFQSTGYHMESTVLAIENSLGQQGPAQTVMTKEAAQRLEEQMFKQAVEESLRMWPDSEDSPTKETLYQTLEDPVYSDFRAEASAHYRQRQECFDKAAAAYKRGMKDVASYYSQQGHVHTEKLKEANLRAAEKIVDLKNTRMERTNSIDLHGLHVDEAVHVLETILTQREIEQRERPDRRKTHLTVVTGRGTHSRGGVAKIRPAVLDFLRRNNYRWTETNPSMLKVLLKYSDA